MNFFKRLWEEYKERRFQKRLDLDYEFIADYASANLQIEVVDEMLRDIMDNPNVGDERSQLFLRVLEQTKADYLAERKAAFDQMHDTTQQELVRQELSRS